MNLRSEQSSVLTADEYLTIADVAARLRVSPKRVRNLMAAKVFVQGQHFFRPRGMGPRFRWSRVVAWLEGESRDSAEPIPMARSRARLAAGQATHL